MTDTLEDADFGDLVELAGKELKRRFEKDPDSLPGTFVIKLFLDGSKALALQGGDDDGEAPVAPDVLSLVQTPGLPVERKRELLEAEAEKCRVRLVDIDVLLEAL